MPFVVSSGRTSRSRLLNSKGLGATVHRRPNQTMKIGQVYEQGTVAGARVNKGTKIDIYVSTGPPKVDVPDVMGKSRDDAIAALADAKLKFKVLTGLLEGGRRTRSSPSRRPAGGS